MLLKELMDPQLLSDEVAGGWITAKQHPHFRLTIYTYTRACQYKRHWNAATINCRGLIVDETTQEIVGRPFPKFFNWDEHETGEFRDYAPPLDRHEPFDIYEKMDGSLGIIFNYGGHWLAASKGSFISEQAQWAQRQLDSGVWDDEVGAVVDSTRGLLKGWTYLCEIIYPENRIVVDYGRTRNLTLLAIYGPDGRESKVHEGHAEDWAPLGPVVKQYPAATFARLVTLAVSNIDPDGKDINGTEHEGFVLKFRESGTRVKIKYGDYKRLHKVLTGVTAVDVWRSLAVALLRGKLEPKQLARTLSCSPDEVQSLLSVERPLDGVLENVPDEFDAWVREVCDDLTRQADTLRQEIMDTWRELKHLAADRREYALKAKEYPAVIRSGLFLAVDGKNLEPLIWAHLKPSAQKPFKEDHDG